MTMWATLAISLSLVAEGQDGLRFGAAVLSGDTSCMQLGGASVPKGTAVTLVTPDIPQKLFRARVDEAVEVCDVLRRATLDGPYYRLVLLDPDHDSRVVGIAIVGGVKASASQDRVELEATDREGLVTVRSCTSKEGFHLTAWSGKPLAGRRLWHTYWYLGYDTEPSCEERDWQ